MSAWSMVFIVVIQFLNANVYASFNSLVYQLANTSCGFQLFVETSTVLPDSIVGSSDVSIVQLLIVGLSLVDKYLYYQLHHPPQPHHHQLLFDSSLKVKSYLQVFDTKLIASLVGHQSHLFESSMESIV